MTPARRAALLALVLSTVLAFAACAGAAPAGTAPSGTAPSATAPAGTRTVVHERGTVEVPVAPRSVVALDEYAALNLLAVGVRPTTVFGGLSSQIGAEVLRADGIEVVPAPTMITSPDLEAIAATRPDVIVLTSSGGALDATYPRLAAVAPTVVLPFEGPWRAPIELAGAAFGASARADRLVGVLQQRLDRLRERTVREPRTLSVLGSFQGLLYSPAPVNPGSELVAAAGFGRPQAQLAAASGASASTIPVSPEQLSAHDADRIIVLDGSIYDAAAVTRLPTFAGLPAVRAGHVDRVVGEMWAGGTALATWWVLDDLDALLDGRTVGAPADGAARAGALDAAVGG